jgi:hypothetical protein
MLAYIAPAERWQVIYIHSSTSKQDATHDKQTYKGGVCAVGCRVVLYLCGKKYLSEN